MAILKAIWDALTAVSDPRWTLVVGAIGGFLFARWLYHYKAERAKDDKEQAEKTLKTVQDDCNTTKTQLNRCHNESLAQTASHARTIADKDDVIQLGNIEVAKWRGQYEAAIRELKDRTRVMGLGSRQEWRNDEAGVSLWFVSTKRIAQLGADIHCPGTGWKSGRIELIANPMIS